MTAAVGTPPVHDLLLGLAGRVDDDLLAWARELLAVGEDDQAVELVTAAVAADRVVLPPTLRAALVAAARAAHTDLDVDRALPLGSSEATMAHRFDAAARPGDAVVAALTALPGRRLQGCTAYLTWRRTAAGAASGPVPHPVVLVEVDADRSAEVLAYVLATELQRAGAPASVEVFTTGATLPAYHTAALRGARPVVGRAPVDEPARPADGDRDARADAGGLADVGAPDVTEHEDVDQGHRSDRDGKDRGAEADPTSTPLFLVPPPVPSEPADGTDPAQRRSGGWDRDPPAETGTPRLPGRRRRAEPATEAAGLHTPPADGPSTAVNTPGPDTPWPDNSGPDTPGPDGPVPNTDPFHGPLRVPLLAPLLDPTGPDPATSPPAADRVGSDRVGSEPGGSHPGASDLPRRRSRAAGEPAVEPERTARPPSTPGPGEGTPVPAEWEEDWRSGEWAMPRTPQPEQSGDGDKADQGRNGRFDAFNAFNAFGVPAADTSDHVSLFDSPIEQSRNGPPPERPGDDVRPPADDPLFGPLDRDRLLFDDAGPPSGGPPLFHDVRELERPASGGPSHSGPPRETRPFGDADKRAEAAPDPAAERPTPDTPAAGRQTGPVSPSTPRPSTPRPSTPSTPNPSPTTSSPSSPGTPNPGTAGRPTPPRPPAPDPGPKPSGPGPQEAWKDVARATPDGEPSGLLSGTERDLLSQLHAELSLPERRPRPYRRAGRPGVADAVNGHGHAPAPDGERPPPDLAS